MATITEDYVSFETAKLLKEKGFDSESITAYYFFMEGSAPILNRIEPQHFVNQCGGNISLVGCPTLQMAMKWLREVHNIIIVYTPSVICSDSLEWISSIRTYNAEENYLEDQGIVGNYDTYEEACEAAIKYCLENLI